MSSDNQSKYGANRNLWRKHYPIGSPRREPQTVSLVDTDTDTSYSLNLQTTIRHRDYYKIIQFATSSLEPTGSAPVVYGEYDEGLVWFDGTYEQTTFPFNIAFSGVPIIVYTVESTALDDPPNYQENIIAFGAGPKTPYSGDVAISAPYSGTVRYRAIYAASYPGTFSSSYTSSFVASAGQNELFGDSTTFTASFTTMGAVPSEFRITPYNMFDITGNDVNLAVDHGSFTTTTVAGDISAPYSGVVDYIAYSSITP